MLGPETGNQLETCCGHCCISSRGLPTHLPFDQGVLSPHLPVKSNAISYAPWWVPESSNEHLGNRGSFVFSESARPELLASKFRVALSLLTDPLLPLVAPLPPLPLPAPTLRVPAPAWTPQPQPAAVVIPQQHELSEPEKMNGPVLDTALSLSSPRRVAKQPKRGARRSSMKSVKKASDFTFTVVFTGYDHDAQLSHGNSECTQPLSSWHDSDSHISWPWHDML